VMAVRTMAPATASAVSASVVGISGLAPRGELAGDLAYGLDQLLGHPTYGGQDLAQG
jgi:hypothetical protein